MCEPVCNASDMTRRELQRRYDKESIAAHHKKLMSREYSIHHIGKESITAHDIITTAPSLGGDCICTLPQIYSFPSSKRNGSQAPPVLPTTPPHPPTNHTHTANHPKS